MSSTGGGNAGSPLDEIDEIVADILGKQNVNIVGIQNKDDLLSFLHEAVEQPPRYEAFVLYLFLTVCHGWQHQFSHLKDGLHDPDTKKMLRLPTRL